MALFVQDNVSVGMGCVCVCLDQINCSCTSAVIGFLAEMLLVMTGGVLSGYVQMLTGYLHAMWMVTSEEIVVDL